VSVQLKAKLVDVRKHLDDARQRRKEVDFALKYTRRQLDEIQRQDSSIAALSRILEDIHRLEQKDSVQLLWGESCTDSEAEQKRLRLEVSLRDYDTRVSTTQHRIRTLLDECTRLDRAIETLNEQQEQLSDLLKRIADDVTLQHELKQTFSSQIVLPWSNRHNDAVRQRIIMATAMVAALLLTVILPRWEVPEPERVETIEIPERLATLIVKKPPPPPPPEPPKPEEGEEQADAEPEAEPAPEPEEKSEARKTVEKAGLLAFKQDFSQIMDASADIKLGSQAKIVTQGAPQRRQPATRSMITSNVQFSESGAAAASVSRKDVIGDENKLKKVEFTHIENPQVAALDSRQMANNIPSATRRSDEEIQVVFDRYKDALYRIYNRELRKNSLLKGKLVLKLTIEPDGNVSNCKVESSELNSGELEKKIIARVMRFNFGAKKGAKSLTILYPIDFLPAT
jgi:outer membrane biosynthesis protein TonB